MKITDEKTDSKQLIMTEKKKTRGEIRNTDRLRHFRYQNEFQQSEWHSTVPWKYKTTCNISLLADWFCGNMFVIWRCFQVYRQFYAQCFLSFHTNAFVARNKWLQIFRYCHIVSCSHCAAWIAIGGRSEQETKKQKQKIHKKTQFDARYLLVMLEQCNCSRELHCNI